MASPYRLLVYAIAAVALIALVYSIFPKPVPDPASEITEMLKGAEGIQGKGSSGTVSYSAESAFSKSTFDSSNRNVVFQCNNAFLCCPREQSCSAAIEWGPDRVKFNRAAEFVTTARCSYEHGLFSCTIYVGEKPAQIEIEAVQAEEQYDLAAKELQILVFLLNSGGLPAEQSVVEVKLFKKYMQDGLEMEKIVGSATKTEETGRIGAGERKEVNLQLELFESGKYRAEITAHGLEAGFDSKDAVFNVISPDFCAATGCGATLLEFGECVTLCRCKNCLIGKNCEEKVREHVSQISVGDSLLPISLKESDMEIMGSDLVKVFLPAAYCT